MHALRLTCASLALRPAAAHFSLSSARGFADKQDPNPQRSRQGEEEGIKTDDVAATDAAFKRGSPNPAQAKQEVARESGDSMQPTAANETASKPEGSQQEQSPAANKK